MRILRLGLKPICDQCSFVHSSLPTAIMQLIIEWFTATDWRPSINSKNYIFLGGKLSADILLLDDCESIPSPSAQKEKFSIKVIVLYSFYYLSFPLMDYSLRMHLCFLCCEAFRTNIPFRPNNSRWMRKMKFILISQSELLKPRDRPTKSKRTSDGTRFASLLLACGTKAMGRLGDGYHLARLFDAKNDH